MTAATRTWTACCPPKRAEESGNDRSSCGRPRRQGASSGGGPIPFLSHSRVSRYLHCPEQYRLYYIERLRPRAPHASLVFGQYVHEAIAVLLRSQGDPVAFFDNAWKEVRQLDVTYGRESWEKLRVSGNQLVEKFVREELHRLGTVQAVEQIFTLAITCLDVPFVGVIDLVGEVDGASTVVDFKTAASRYEAHEVMLSDQLTAYSSRSPGAPGRRSACC